MPPSCFMQFRWFLFFVLVLTVLALPAVYAEDAARLVNIVERSDDDLVLVQLRLGRIVLNESLPGYLTKNHLMLPLGQIAEALQFPIKVNPPEGQADGWFLDPANNFTLDAARHEVVISGSRSTFAPDLVEVHQDDIYVDTTLLSQWWPVEFNFSFSTQTVTVSGKNGMLLPVQREASRDQARALLGSKQQEAAGPFPRLDTPLKRQVP